MWALALALALAWLWLWLWVFALWNHGSSRGVDLDQTISQRHLKNLPHERMNVLDQAVGTAVVGLFLQQFLQFRARNEMDQFRA
jgi:hypothetical protein